MSDEITRGLIRELHGLMNDGERLKRDIHAAQHQLMQDLRDTHKSITERTAEITAEVAGQCSLALNETLARYADDIAALVYDANLNIQQRATELAGMHDPDEFMNEIVERLGGSIARILEDKMREIAEDAINDTVTLPPRLRGQTKKEKHVPPASIPHVTLPPLPNISERRHK